MKMLKGKKKIFSLITVILAIIVSIIAICFKSNNLNVVKIAGNDLKKNDLSSTFDYTIKFRKSSETVVLKSDGTNDRLYVYFDVNYIDEDDYDCSDIYAQSTNPDVADVVLTAAPVFTNDTEGYIILDLCETGTAEIKLFSKKDNHLPIPDRSIDTMTVTVYNSYSPLNPEVDTSSYVTLKKHSVSIEEGEYCTVLLDTNTSGNVYYRIGNESIVQMYSCGKTRIYFKGLSKGTTTIHVYVLGQYNIEYGDDVTVTVTSGSSNGNQNQKTDEPQQNNNQTPTGSGRWRKYLYASPSSKYYRNWRNKFETRRII